MKTIALFLMVAVATSMTLPAAVGDVVASASSPQTWMDMETYANAIIEIGQDAKPERLAYSGWTWFLDGRTSGTVRITDNDVEIASFTGEGVYEWVPSVPDVHNVKLIISGGPTYEQVYLVEGPKVTIVRGTDPAMIGGISCAITSTAPGATIYFTTDGTEPTTESRVYTGPFAINPAMVTAVRAFCVAEGWPRSHTAMKLFMPAENMEIVSKSDSVQTFLDTRAGKGVALEAQESEPIVWSGLWSADANANVMVTVNGEPFVSGKGEGVEVWTPTVAGLYTFQHTTAGSSEALEAIFNVVAKDIALVQVAVDCRDVTYSGSAFTPAIQSATWGGKTLVEGTDYTLAYSGNLNAGTATITLAGINLFNGTYTTNFTIKAKSLTSAMVGAVGNVTYTGSAHKPQPTVTDTARGVTLVKGTDYTLSWGANMAAGSGSVTVTGKGNYTGSITKNFTIAKAEVTPPTIAVKAYTGGLLKADVSSTARYTVQNDGGVNAGNYPVTLTLTDAANYRWAGGDSNPLNLTFTITKASNSWITQPSVTGWTYGQAANAPNMGAAKFGTVGVTYSATPQNAGSYTATFTVPGTANYEGLTKSVPFTIAKATYDMGGARWGYTGAFKYDGGVKTVVVSGLPLGVTVASYSGNTATAPGTYTAHAELSYDTANYNAPTMADCVWTIKSAEETKLKEIFEDLPAEITPDGEGGWKVTLTNDLDLSEGPLEIPDNLGPVAIDLNGHDLIGADGSDGGPRGDLPGGDGQPAIRIVPGEGGGAATELSIVTTGGDSLVKGGDGGAGTPGGNGAAAIEVDDKAKAGVKVDVGAGVTVKGGDGGNSDTGRGGDGGAGIDGNVGVNDGTITGGSGGASVSGDGGNGGAGVDGNVDVNNGAITGGSGGASDTGRGGDGGLGVTGDIGTNNGTVSGGKGGASEQGGDGADGKAVGGTVGGGTGTVRRVKVPVPEIPAAEWTGERIAPQVPASPLYAVSASGGTRPGSYPVMLTLLDTQNYEWLPREGAAVSGALAVADFVIADPPPRIEASAGDAVAVYDGEGHGISVAVAYPPSGWTVRYATSAAGPFADAPPLFTNAVSGAATWYEVSAAGFDPVTNAARVTVAPRSLAKAALGALRFEDRDGVRTPVPTLVDDLGREVPPSDYAFTWEEEASGAMTLSFTGRGNYLGLFGTRLAQTRFRVVFDANGGALGEDAPPDGAADYDIGTYYGALPVPSRAGYLFDGWYESADLSGDPVTRNTEVIAQDLTLHAKWLRRALWYTDATFHLEGAAAWDGYIVDPAAGDRVAGTIQVKAGKPNRKTGLSKLTVTVQLAGGKKAKLKGSTFDGTLSGDVGGRALKLRLGCSSLSGTLGGYALDGARNVFAAKDADSKVVAAQALKRWQGTYVAAWAGASGWNGLSLEVKSKGKAKVSGTLADGAKVSAKGQLLVGERECALAVSWTKKASSVAGLVWFREDGTVECMNADGAETLVANARDGAYLPAGAAFRTGAAASAAVPGLLPALLPDGVAVRMKGAKFDIDRAGKVSAKGGALDLSKAGTNPSGLKLAYKMKNCTFKGSFTAYALAGGKLRKVKVQVSGVVLGGAGYGTASARKAGSWPVTITAPPDGGEAR